MAQTIKNPPAMQEIQFNLCVGKTPPEKEMASHPSILDRRISWTEEPGALQSTGLQRVGHDRVTYTFTFTGDKKNIKLNIKDCY